MNHMTIGRKKVVSLMGVSLLMSGCASATPAQRGALLGSAAGAGLGAIIGHQAGRKTAEGALIGAAAGGIGGALLGESTASKYCPTCGRSFFADQTYCEFDGAVLRTKGTPVQTATQVQLEPVQVRPVEVPQTLVINVPNSNGSFTPVTLQPASNGTYVGPRGEVYPTRPTVDQLKQMYGK